MQMRLVIFTAVALLLLTGCAASDPVGEQPSTEPAASDPTPTLSPEPTPTPTPTPDPACTPPEDVLLDRGYHVDVNAKYFIECLAFSSQDTVYWRIIFYVEGGQPIAFKELDFYNDTLQNNGQLTRKARFPLMCEPIGNVAFGSDSANLSEGYILCKEQESLRQIISALSEGQITRYDTEDQFPGENVAVYFEWDVNTQLAGQNFHPLVHYTQTNMETNMETNRVSFSISGSDGYRTKLEISGATVQSVDDFTSHEPDWLCVRQRGEDFYFSVEPYTLFPYSFPQDVVCQNKLRGGTISGTAGVHLFDTTTPQTLYIGYDPKEPDARLMGTIKQVIFDPNDSCYDC